jgi:hypothetical protein
MKHYLRIQAMGHFPELPISEDEFQAIKTARAVLSAAFALEESYDLLISNYVELEQELLLAAAETLARDRHAYDSFFDLRATINRRAVNLLTASRLYLDQAPQYLGACASTPETAKSELKKRLSAHYDSSYSYRLLEALRNHVQHCGLAVHKLSIGSRWTGDPSSSVLEASVLPFAVRRHLAEDNQFKKTVLLETPEEVNLMGCIREYLQCLGDIHKHLRSIVASAAENARTLLQSHISQHSVASSGQVLGLAAVRSDPATENQTVSLLLDWDDVRLQLIKRNRTLANLSRHVVTGRTL